MELAEFNEGLGRMTTGELHGVSRSHELHHSSPADEVDAWHAVVHIDAVLRKTRHTRQAARAAYVAAQTVLASAVADGMALPDPTVTSVARAAALVARGIVAGEHAEADVEWLLLEWSPLFAVAVSTSPVRQAESPQHERLERN